MIKKNKKINYIILSIIIMGLASRLVIFFMIKPYHSSGMNIVLKDDAYGYHLLSKEIINNGSFGRDDPYVSALRTPGYPVFISLFYKLFGEHQWIIIIVQLCLELILIYLIFYFTKLISIKEKTAYIAAFLYAIEPIAIQYSNILLSDSIFTLFIFLSYLYYYQYLSKNKRAYLFLSSFILAIATYIRPVGMYLIIVNIVFAAIYNLNNKKFRFRDIFISLLLFFLFLAPWTIRNKVKHGHYFFSTSGKYNSLILYASDVEAEATGVDQRIIIENYRYKIAAENLPISHKNIFIVHKKYKEEAIRIIKTYPFAFIKTYILGVIDMFFSVNRNFWDMISHNDNKVDFDAIKLLKEKKFNAIKIIMGNYSLNTIFYSLLMILWFIITYLMCILGISHLLKEKRRLILLLLLVPIFYFTAVTGQAGLARFKLPMIPFYYILSATGLIKSWKSVIKSHESI